MQVVVSRILPRFTGILVFVIKTVIRHGWSSHLAARLTLPCKCWGCDGLSWDVDLTARPTSILLRNFRSPYISCPIVPEKCSPRFSRWAVRHRIKGEIDKIGALFSSNMYIPLSWKLLLSIVRNTRREQCKIGHLINFYVSPVPALLVFYLRG